MTNRILLQTNIQDTNAWQQSTPQERSNSNSDVKGNDIWNGDDVLADNQRFNFVLEYLQQANNLIDKTKELKLLSCPSSYEVVQTADELLENGKLDAKFYNTRDEGRGKFEFSVNDPNFSSRVDSETSPIYRPVETVDDDALDLFSQGRNDVPPTFIETNNICYNPRNGERGKFDFSVHGANFSNRVDSEISPIYRHVETVDDDTLDLFSQDRNDISSTFIETKHIRSKQVFSDRNYVSDLSENNHVLHFTPNSRVSQDPCIISAIKDSDMKCLDSKLSKSATAVKKNVNSSLTNHTLANSACCEMDIDATAITVQAMCPTDARSSKAQLREITATENDHRTHCSYKQSTEKLERHLSVHDQKFLTSKVLPHCVTGEYECENINLSLNNDTSNKYNNGEVFKEEIRIHNVDSAFVNHSPKIDSTVVDSLLGKHMSTSTEKIRHINNDKCPNFESSLPVDNTRLSHYHHSSTEGLIDKRDTEVRSQGDIGDEFSSNICMSNQTLQSDKPETDYDPNAYIASHDDKNVNSASNNIILNHDIRQRPRSAGGALNLGNNKIASNRIKPHSQQSERTEVKTRHRRVQSATGRQSLSYKQMGEKSRVAWGTYNRNNYMNARSLTPSGHAVQNVTRLFGRGQTLRGADVPCNSSRLPNEIWYAIFRLLSRKDLCEVAKVCRKFCEIASDRLLWKEIVADNVELTDEVLLTLGMRQPIHLTLRNCKASQITDQGLRWLFKNCKDTLESLTMESCTGKYIGGDMVFLHAACHCRNLKKISVPWTGTSDNGLTAICHVMTGMTDVNVTGNPGITDESFDVMSQRHAHCLQHLEIAGCFSVTAAALLRLTSNASHLQKLNVGLCNKLTTAHVISMCAKLCAIIHLDMHGVKAVNDRCLHVIATSCQQLHVLIVRNCNAITDTGIAELATYLPTLRHVDVSSCSLVTDRGISNLVSVSRLMEHLDVSSTAISHLSVVAAAEHNSATLRCLKLSFCRNVTQACLETLIGACVQLRLLHVYGCKQAKLSQLSKINSKLLIEK